ncbi:hypothetical protein C0995_002657 [Termitomyces sp. Mi166|nr:hypothetical protein C0995_002657 [Termitomyces sp. Mi166\
MNSDTLTVFQSATTSEVMPLDSDDEDIGVTQTMAKALAPPPSDTVIYASQCYAAIKQAEKETWLSMQGCLTFVKILEKDNSVVDSYLAIENEEFHQIWVQDKIDSVF